MLQELIELQIGIAKETPEGFRRYLASGIDWSNRLCAIIGARGVGKTTLMLQRYREEFDDPQRCLYLSADNVIVAALGLFEIAAEFFRMGGECLLIDEIHKYGDWSKELKNIYDSFPKGRLVISGSSTLDIMKGRHDLSRRMVVFPLRGMSFREYLEVETGRQFASFTLRDLIDDHVAIAARVNEAGGVLRHFQDYLRHGYYPFYLEGTTSFGGKLNNVVEKIVSEDIPSVFGVRPASVPALRKLIYLVATSQPFVPNIDRISSNLGVSKEYIYNYFEYLERAGLFASLRRASSGLRLVRKAERVYMENPNLIHAIVGRVESAQTGAIRESFFVSQLRERHEVSAAERGDFLVDGRYTFEVGGRGKADAQIAGVEDAFVASDGIEAGVGNRIPLWLFGFLY